MTLTLLNLLQRIATVYDTLTHSPHDTVVIRAYAAFKTALLTQYRAIPYRVLFVDTDPYLDSADMFRKVEASGILQVYTGGELPENHPMHKPMHCPCCHSNAFTVVGCPDCGSEPIGRIGQSTPTYNHIFRAIHDALIHIPNRFSFGPVGEFKAFQAHAKMLVSPFGAQWAKGSWVGDSEALRALATETLAQSARFNTIGNAKTFAPQKACLLPDSLIVEALELEV